MHVKKVLRGFAALALALATALTVATPAMAASAGAGQFQVSAPQSKAYTGHSIGFKSTVKDAKGNVLTEGKDFVRSYYWTDQRRENPSASLFTAATDDNMYKPGFVFEQIKGINDYSAYGTYTIRHSIWTLYNLTPKDATKVEGEDDPAFTSEFSILGGNKNTSFADLYGKDFVVTRQGGDRPGTYTMSVKPGDALPQPYKSNAEGTLTGIGLSDKYYTVVGDKIAGYNLVYLKTGTFTIVKATENVSFTIKWDDSSNADKVRPSASEYAKYLTLKADGKTVNATPTVTDNGNNTYTVTYKGVDKYAYKDSTTTASAASDSNSHSTMKAAVAKAAVSTNKAADQSAADQTAADKAARYEIPYTLTQSAIANYKTTNPTASANSAIVNVHEVAKVTPKPQTPKTTPKATAATKSAPVTKKASASVPKTGDNTVSGVAFAACGIAALGAAALLKRRHA